MTPTKEIPVIIRRTARNRPSVVVGYLSPYPTVVTVVTAHQSPSLKFLILEPSTVLSLMVIWIAAIYEIKTALIQTFTVIANCLPIATF